MLLAHVLDLDRARLLARLEAPLPPGAWERFDALVQRRVRFEPLAYLLGHQEFFGRDFLVDRRVLVPRPETELLVADALHYLDECTRFRGGLPRVADIGTGSGVIAVTLAAETPGLTVWAGDASPEALEVARQNAARHGVADRVILRSGVLVAPLPPEMDLLIANLPYVRDDQIDAQTNAAELTWEPRAALSGGPDGLAVIRRFLATAGTTLKPGGVILMEIAWDQGPAVTALARERFPQAHAVTLRDMAGLNRIVAVGPQDVVERLARWHAAAVLSPAEADADAPP
ncbi:MAG: peptide chain release factor N(5)-glutamine methyltransferase [Chloroflexi bacterium]|nr:peptide chain release factor N(5)-glutamine methyltransferase [Chloroflexota bacterium]